MKNSILFFTIISLLFSCNKDISKVTNGLAGKWKLNEILMDPGDGSGTFSTVNSNKIIEFDNNGNVSSNGSLCDMSIETNISSTGTYSETDSTLKSDNCQSSTIRYELNHNILIIIYPCFESCKAKYIKIK